MIDEGKAFTQNIALADGRITAVVNQPMESGGWVATHEDITERKRAEHELEQDPPVPRHHPRERADAHHREERSRICAICLINRAAEKFLGAQPNERMLGKTASRRPFPPPTAAIIEAEDRKLIESGESPSSTSTPRHARQRHPDSRPPRGCR